MPHDTLDALDTEILHWQRARHEGNGVPILSPPAQLRAVGLKDAPAKFRYCVPVEKLGNGGMGAVYRSWDETLERIVALKSILPTLETRPDYDVFRRRFVREARAMAKLNHARIVSIHHIEDDQRPFFVMPLLRGESLDKRQRREGLFLIEDVIRIGFQVADGLAHAHSKGLIHRDIKPGNIWLEEGDRDIKILDFGLVHMDEESTELTNPGQGMGSWPYASPEQQAGLKTLDSRTDQYSLGAVLYLLCTGRRVTVGFRQPQYHNANVPNDLNELIVRLLSAEPADRYPSMKAVREELAYMAVPVVALSMPAFPTRPSVGTPVIAPTVVPLPQHPRTFTNSIGMKFVLVEPGTLWIGSPPNEANRSNDETQHEVTITKAFYMAIHPVTQGQWAKVMGKNPSYFSRTGGGASRVRGLSDADLALFPVEDVSWEDAQTFLKALAALNEEAKCGRKYHLPSEAEWEFACRGGGLGDPHQTQMPFHFTQPTSSLSSTQANFDGNHPYGGAAIGPYLERTSKVGSYKPNALGIFDMHGNVWEWCADLYAAYPTKSATDPSGPRSGSCRVSRGGSWNDSGQFCRAAYRYGDVSEDRYGILGFRIAAVPAREPS